MTLSLKIFKKPLPDLPHITCKLLPQSHKRFQMYFIFKMGAMVATFDVVTSPYQYFVLAVHTNAEWSILKIVTMSHKHQTGAAQNTKCPSQVSSHLARSTCNRFVKWLKHGQQHEGS